ncbi:MAG TPA: serine hydrolase [Candidatus Egerieousia sp.]|nr:serine hydrolase [Candidatus Egerieousia sp.]
MLKRALIVFHSCKIVLFAVSVGLAFSLAGCGGGNGGGTVNPEPETTKSSSCTLSNFQILTTANSGLSVNAAAVIKQIQGVNMVFITVPDGFSLSSVKPTFSISSKSSMTINGNVATSASTAFDFSNVATAVVTAENGTNKTTYNILVRNGNATIDNEVYAIMASYNIPGVSVAATKNEALVYSAGYGFADVAAKTRTTPNMLFRLASMSKQQTVLCIMTLVEEGRLSLDDYLFAPAGANGTGSKEGILYSMYSGTHANGVDKMKIRHFLSHTSGWQYATTGGADPVFTGDSRFYGKSLTDRVTYMVANVATSYTPGSYYSYYNLDYCVLGQVIEKLTGKDYETYLRSVVAKAGITDMWVAKTLKTNKRSNEVTYYSQTSGNDGYSNDMEVIKACGGVIASAPELMQLLCAEDYGTVVPDILKSGSLDQIYSIVKATDNYNYGFGWHIGHSAFGTWASYHGGDLSGTATLWVRGNNGINAVLLCNSRNNDSGFDTALYYAIDNIRTAIK